MTRTYINLGIVFFLTGLWHGANYTFVIWGLYHGFFSILERAGLEKYLTKSRVLSHVYLFFLVCFGWVIFRVDNFMDGLLFIKRLLMPWLYTGFDIAPWKYGNSMTVFVFICAVVGMGIVQRAVPENVRKAWKDSVIEFVYCAALLIACIAVTASGTYNPFIYFQF